MSARTGSRQATRPAAALAVALVAACASHTAPRGFLPDAEEAQTDAYGGWIDLQMRTADGVENVAGELIAVSADSVWVLNGTGGVVLPIAAIVGGQLVGWDSKSGNVGAYTALGTLSTISNGILLIFTAPMWVIGGSFAAASQSRHPIQRLLPADWMRWRPFARFPQGIPRGVAFRELHMRR